MCTLPTITSKYTRQILVDLAREIDKPTTLDEDFNTPLSENDRMSRQKNQ